MHNNIYNIHSAILKKHIRKHGKKNQEGKTLIFEEALWNDISLKTLLNEGCNINEVDTEGKTPLFYCEHKKHLIMFLMNGANLNHLDHKGRNILYYLENPEIAKLSVQLRIKLNTKDVFGRFFLSYHSFHKYPEVFSDQFSFFKNEEIEIFQLFKYSLVALKMISDNSINLTFPCKILLRFDPNKNQKALAGLMNFIKEKVGANHFEKIKFVHEETNSNVVSLYTPNIRLSSKS